MLPIATEVVDDEGVTLVRAWIESLVTPRASHAAP